MFISFIPALGETTEIVVPSAAFLQFQATLLAPLGQGEIAENKLILRAPVFSTSTQVYNFTYRLVHASGEIEWLGEYGQNGSLILQKAIRYASNSGHLEYHEDSRVIHPTAKDIQLVSRDQSSCFMRGSLGKLTKVGDAGSLKLDIPWLVQHTIIRGSPQEVLIWSAELPSAEYLGPSRPVLDLPVLPAGGILTIASQDATKNPLPTPPPSPRMKSPVLQSLASTSMAASRSNALVVRQQGTSWLFRLLGQLFRLMLSILVWILKRRRRTRHSTTPVTSPDSSQKQVVLAQMLEPTFSVLVSSQSSTNLKSHLLEVVGLGDVDVLTYDIGGVGLIRISC
ncbi:hypothetical protein DL96DRAFT_1574228 [Flagelloscypha sp. PMI_526]|nr:hypothetical protein DL96DRAFT_1574228 [Flagelloscypha sp. PMI_526]